MFYFEKKLDEHRRAIGLMEYWPSQQDQSGQLMSHSGFETAMAGFASMDELFRKSGLLAYSQLSQQEPQISQEPSSSVFSEVVANPPQLVITQNGEEDYC